MSDDLAEAAMYALRGLVGGLRDANLLNDAAIDALQSQIDMALHYAAVLESSSASPPDPSEARIIRHGTWWLRECVAPTGNFAPGPVTDHPSDSAKWPKLRELLQSDE